jgi:Tfp pilus assembly protein PilE
MKKRGVTLIEIVIVMAVAFLMVAVVDSMLISYLNNYKVTVLQSKGINYLSEALAIIEKEVNQDTNKVITEENVIKIDHYNKNTKNYIKCINRSLYVLYGEEFTIPTNRSPKGMIIDDVEEFVAIRSKKTLYIKITWCDGQKIERCLLIENAN